MTPALVGALVGLALGTGLLLVLRGVPVLRRTTLDQRLDPYVRDVPRPSGLVALAAAPRRGWAAAALVEPLVHDLVQLLHRTLGSSRVLPARLRHAGRPVDVDAYRLQQLQWGAVGLLLGIVCCSLLRWQRDSAPGALAVLVLVAGISGALARDWALSRQIARRRRRLLDEFPVVAEMLALAVGAGEGPMAAVERVTRLVRGELSTELELVLADGRSGARIDRALHGLGERTGLPVLRRFVDGMVVAIERGTPLADVLRAQAADVREARQRDLVESAGRKEIAMMVPVVFVVLPVTVLFAVFPGFAFLRLGT